MHQTARDYLAAAMARLADLDRFCEAEAAAGRFVSPALVRHLLRRADTDLRVARCCLGAAEPPAPPPHYAERGYPVPILAELDDAE